MNEPNPTPRSRTYKVLMLSLGQATASVAGFVILAVLSRQFSKQEYASYRQFILCFTMLMPFLNLGIPMALYYYLPTEKTRARGLVVDNLILLLMLGAAYGAFLLLGGAAFFSDRMANPGLRPLLLVAAPYGMVLLVRSSFPACFMSADKPRYLAIYNAVSRSFECILVVLAAIISRRLLPTVIASVIAPAIVVCGGLVVIFRIYDKGAVKPSLKSMGRQLKYGAPLWIAAIFGSVMGYLDQFIVSVKCSSEAFAVYVNGAIRVPLLSVVVMSVSSVLIPELTVLYKAGDRRGMLRLWQNAMVKSAYIMLPFTLFLAVLAPDFILLLFSEKYLASITIFRIFLIALPFQMISYGPIFHASAKNKYIAVSNIATLFFHIPLLMIAVGRFGPVGAVVVTVISQVCVRVLLHVIFIGKITESRTVTVIPVPRLWKILWPAVLLSLPLVLRYTVKMPPVLSLTVWGAYYLPACYFWLTRRADAPRVALVEGSLHKVLNLIKSNYGMCHGNSSD